MAEGRLVHNIKHDYLTCSICVETFVDPKTLQCGHSFCSVCLEGYLRSSPEIQDMLVCPICRQKCPLERHEDPKEVIDSLHCDRVLLSILNAVRPLLHSGESELLVNATDLSNKSSQRKIEYACAKHPDKDVDVYCSVHDIAICPKCAVKDHNDDSCNCIPIDGVISKRFNALKSLVAQQVADASQLFQSKDPCVDTLESTHESFHKSIADVEEKFVELCKVFDTRIKRLKQNTNETVEKNASANAVKGLQVDLIEKIKFFEQDDQTDNPNRRLRALSEMCSASSRFQVHIRNFSDEIKTGSLLWNCERDLSALDRFMTTAQEAMPQPFVTYAESSKDTGDDDEYVMVTNSGQFADTIEAAEDSIDRFQQYTFGTRQAGEQNNNLSSIALLGTTALVVVDQMNRKLKKFKIPEGRFLSEIKLDFEPHQVAAIPESSHLLVTIWEVPTVLILASDPALELLRVVETDTEYIGVASHIAGVLAVSSIRHSRVDILEINQAHFDITGRETISRTSRYRSFPDRLAVTRNQSIIVRNKRRNEVKCVDRKHKVVWSRRFKSTVADVACFRGKVFASLVKKNEIFCFQENGIEDVKSFKPIREINCPWSMDGFKDCLAVTEDAPSDLVHVFVFSSGN